MIDIGAPELEVNCNTTIEELFGEDKRARAVGAGRSGDFRLFPINAYIDHPTDLNGGRYQGKTEKNS